MELCLCHIRYLSYNIERKNIQCHIVKRILQTYHHHSAEDYHKHKWCSRISTNSSSLQYLCSHCIIGLCMDIALCHCILVIALWPLHYYCHCIIMPTALCHCKYCHFILSLQYLKNDPKKACKSNEAQLYQTNCNKNNDIFNEEVASVHHLSYSGSNGTKSSDL